MAAATTATALGIDVRPFLIPNHGSRYRAGIGTRTALRPAPWKTAPPIHGGHGQLRQGWWVVGFLFGLCQRTGLTRVDTRPVGAEPTTPRRETQYRRAGGRRSRLRGKRNNHSFVAGETACIATRTREQELEFREGKWRSDPAPRLLRHAAVQFAHRLGRGPFQRPAKELAPVHDYIRMLMGCTSNHTFSPATATNSVSMTARARNRGPDSTHKSRVRARNTLTAITNPAAISAA